MEFECSGKKDLKEVKYLILGDIKWTIRNNINFEIITLIKSLKKNENTIACIIRYI